MWQNEIINDKFELLTRGGALATSKHVSAQVIKAAGTGYEPGASFEEGIARFVAWLEERGEA